MSFDIHSISVGETWRSLGMVAKTSGSAITADCDYFLKCLTGTYAGKWWDGNSWETGEQANAMTHQADGNWTIELDESPFEADVMYLEYAKEGSTPSLHVAARAGCYAGRR